MGKDEKNECFRRTSCLEGQNYICVETFRTLSHQIKLITVSGLIKYCKQCGRCVCECVYVVVIDIYTIIQWIIHFHL